MSVQEIFSVACPQNILPNHKITGISVSSAGTVASQEPPFPATVERLAHYDCDPSQHIQRKINEEILKDQDLIICMAEHHRQSIRELGHDAILFNEIAYNKSEDLMDDTEYQAIYGIQNNLRPYFIKIIDYIHDAIPQIIENIKKR